jgi:hypothetical protein
MKICGIISTVLGALITFMGIAMNNDGRTVADHFMQTGSTTPGNGAIIIGLMMFVIGVVLLVLNYLKKTKNPPKE